MSRSPFRGFFDAVALGATPRDRDLKAEGFPPDTWPAIRKQVKEIHGLRAENLRQEARRLGRWAGEDWWRRLADDWTPPDTGPDLDAMTPEQLADYIPRT